MLSPAEVWPVKSNGKIIFVTPERINYQIDAKTGELFAKSYGGRESIGLSPDGKYYFIKNMKDTVRAYKAGEISIGTAGAAFKKQRPRKVANHNRLWLRDSTHPYYMFCRERKRKYGNCFYPDR